MACCAASPKRQPRRPPPPSPTPEIPEDPVKFPALTQGQKFPVFQVSCAPVPEPEPEPEPQEVHGTTPPVGDASTLVREKEEHDKAAQLAEEAARANSHEAQLMALAMAELEAEEEAERSKGEAEEAVPPVAVAECVKPEVASPGDRLPYGGSVTFTEDGPLGIRLKRLSNVGAVIAKVNPGSQAEKHLQLREGLVLRSVAGAIVSGLPYDKIVAKMQTAQRPLQLTFATLSPRELESQATEAPSTAQQPVLHGTKEAAATHHDQWIDNGRWKTDPSFPAFDDMGRDKEHADYGIGTPLEAMLPTRKKLDKLYIAAEKRMEDVVEAQAALRHQVATLMDANEADFLLKHMPEMQQTVTTAQENFTRALAKLTHYKQTRLENKLKDLLAADEAHAKLKDQENTKKGKAELHKLAAGVRSESSPTAKTSGRSRRRYSVATGGAAAKDGFDLDAELARARELRPGGKTEPEPVEMTASFVHDGPLGVKWMQFTDKMTR